MFTTNGTYSWSHIFHKGQPSHGGDRKTFEVKYCKDRFILSEGGAVCVFVWSNSQSVSACFTNFSNCFGIDEYNKVLILSYVCRLFVDKCGLWQHQRKQTTKCTRPLSIWTFTVNGISMQSNLPIQSPLLSSHLI